jgi:hypothetical protein
MIRYDSSSLLDLRCVFGQGFHNDTITAIQCNFILQKYLHAVTRSTVLLDKLVVGQLIKKLTVSYGPRRFIGSHLWIILSQMNPFHVFIHYNHYRFILILSSHLRQGLQIGLFRFSDQNVICVSHLSKMCYMPRPSISLDLVTLIISGEEYKL